MVAHFPETCNKVSPKIWKSVDFSNIICYTKVSFYKPFLCFLREAKFLPIC